MMIRASLKTRLEKLEKKLAPKKAGFSNAVLIGVFDFEPEIVGACIGERKVDRQPGESIADLTARASGELKMQFLFALYRDGSRADL